MRLLETLQQYDFDIEYFPGARNYIQDALSRRLDHKTPLIPRVNSTSLRSRLPVPMPPTAPKVTPNCSTDCAPDFTPVSTELVPASGIQDDEWMAQLRLECNSCPYFAGY